MSKAKLAVDAIKKTDIHNSNDKLILTALCSKHAMGEKTTSNWKSVDSFLEDFELKWFSQQDLVEATRLSEVKVQRALDALEESGYVSSNKIDKKFGKKKKFEENELIPKVKVYAIAEQIFLEYRDGTSQSSVSKSA